MNVLHVGYLISCGGLMTVAGMLTSGWHSDRIGSRFGHLILSMLLVAMSFIVMSQARTPASIDGAERSEKILWSVATGNSIPSPANVTARSCKVASP